MAPQEGFEPSVDRLEVYCIIHYAIGPNRPCRDRTYPCWFKASCATTTLRAFIKYQDAAFSIDLPTDLSFQLEGVRIELTTYSLTMNLLQASFFILHIYYIKIFNIFQKRELGANHKMRLARLELAAL